MPDLQQSDNNYNDLLFALTLFNTNRKIMIQGNHRELWVEREFPLLKDLASEKSQGKDLMMLYQEATGTSMDHVWLHAIGSQRTRRIYRLITENIEIDHSSERVVLHLYSC